MFTEEQTCIPAGLPGELRPPGTSLFDYAQQPDASGADATMRLAPPVLSTLRADRTSAPTRLVPHWNAPARGAGLPASPGSAQALQRSWSRAGGEDQSAHPNAITLVGAHTFRPPLNARGSGAGGDGLQGVLKPYLPHAPRWSVRPQTCGSGGVGRLRRPNDAASALRTRGVARPCTARMCGKIKVRIIRIRVRISRPRRRRRDLVADPGMRRARRPFHAAPHHGFPCAVAAYPRRKDQVLC